MKYIGKLLTVATVAIMMVGCGGNAKTEKSVTEEKVDTALSVIKELEDNDTLVSTAEERPCVIDFYATWCAPCKQLAPIMGKMEEKYGKDILFEKIDVDKNPVLAKDYEVESIPTLIFMKPDGTYEKKVGLMSESDLEAEIKKLL